jgi:two-component system chemotaxis response regulator CheB
MVAPTPQIDSFAAVPAELALRPVVVALVCSAGGLDALIQVLQGLPADFPAATIVLQHRQAGRTDHLLDILARRCSLPVAPARDNQELRSGTVIIVPPGNHALLANGDRITLLPCNGPQQYVPSADLLLASLAVVAGPRAIVVILSGMGHDGASGAVAVHRFGGAVIASDKSSSAFFAMPRAAIETDSAVDYVLPLSDISSMLVALSVRSDAAIPATHGGLTTQN